MLKSDRWIREQAAAGMIEPFVPELVREVEGRKVLSYGCSSYGYDLTLSAREFFIFRHVPGRVIDPKNFSADSLERAPLHFGNDGSRFFIIPGHSYGLGVAREKLVMPPNVTGVCVGKSTYARLAIIVNTTPAEACMAEDTDILAKTGWKRLKDVIIGEEVLTLNPETMRSEYKPVLKKQAKYYTGALLHFHGKYIDQLVTPDHKMWVGKKVRRVAEGELSWESKRKGIRREVSNYWEYSLTEAHAIYDNWNYYLARDIGWEAPEPEKTTKIGKHEFPTEFWLRFIGAWMGDGSAYSAKRGNHVIKLAVVTKEAKRSYFRWILENMGVNYQEGERGFSFHSKDLVEYLIPYKGAHNKHLPREIKAMGQGALKLVIEGMMWSDGNLETSTYGSVSERLVDDFQEICIKAGYNCTKWSKTGKVFKNENLTVHKARFSEANTTPCKMRPVENMSLVGYSGLVYDITVDNHIFYSRRNGRASWTGNCWEGHLTLEFSNASGADCRLYANEGICQLLFFEGEQCEVTYHDRAGKYQGQPHSVVTARV